MKQEDQGREAQESPAFRRGEDVKYGVRPGTRRVTLYDPDAAHQIRLDALLDDDLGDRTIVGCACGASAVLPGDATLEACWAAWRTIPHTRDR